MVFSKLSIKSCLLTIRINYYITSVHYSYVGETSRPLLARYKGHFRSAANPTAPSYKNMAFSRHYLERHPGLAPKLSVRILKRTRDSLDRKITEGLFIKKLKPDLNNKYEQLGVVNFLV